MKHKIEGQFVPLTEKLLDSKAWAAAGTHVRRLIDFLMIEHLRHGGQENGKLKAPWRQLCDFGTGARIPERFLADTIEEAIALGLVDAQRGSRRLASTYALTWLHLHDGTPPSNRFTECDVVAEAVIAAAKEAKRRSTSWRRVAPLPTQSEGKLCPHRVKASLPTQSEGKSPFLPPQSEGKTPDFKPTQSEGTIEIALPGEAQGKEGSKGKGSVSGAVGLEGEAPAASPAPSPGKTDPATGVWKLTL